MTAATQNAKITKSIEERRAAKSAAQKARRALKAGAKPPTLGQPKKSKPRDESQDEQTATTKAAKQDAIDHAAEKAANADAGARDPRLPSIGTKIEVERSGVRHIAIEQKDGTFTYVGPKDGERPGYRSLSSIAREILGCAANGFLFFRLTGDTKPATKKGGSRSAMKPVEKGAKNPAEPKIGGNDNEFATPNGQRLALEAAGLTGKKPAAK